MRSGSRGPGVPVNPERVRAARLAAGLSMADLGKKDISRTFIHLVEKGAARPSTEVLEMIAERTGKPVSYFTGPKSNEMLMKQQLKAELDAMAARLRRFRDRASLDRTQQQSVRLLETALRQGAALMRSLD